VAHATETSSQNKETGTYGIPIFENGKKDRLKEWGKNERKDR
jgi:hypothetical protein